MTCHVRNLKKHHSIAIDKSQTITDINFVKFAIAFHEDALVILGPPAADQPEVQHGEQKYTAKKEEKPKDEKTEVKPRAADEKGCCSLL